MATPTVPLLDPPLHGVAQRIVTRLASAGCWYETFTHEAVLTSEAAAATRPGYALRQGAKALLMRYKGGAKSASSTGAFALLVVPADRKLSNKLAKKALGVRDLRFADGPELEAATGGILSGAVPPFGDMLGEGLTVVVDPALLEEERIVFNAGDRRFSVAMRAKDYVRLCQPAVAGLTDMPVVAEGHD